MAAVAGEDLAGPYLQPGGLFRVDAPSVGVQHADQECDVRWHLDAHGPVGLHRGVAHYLTHVVARAECRAGEIDHGAIRNRHCLLDPDEAGGALCRGSLRGISHRRDVGDRGVDAVMVVNTLDVDLPQRGVGALGQQLVQDDVRQSARLRGDDVCDHDSLDRRHDRQQGVLRRIEHPYAVQRRCGLHVRIRQARIGARNDGRGVLCAVHQPALRPADQDAIGAVPQGVGGIEATAR